jgi:hypothetical protein
MRFLFGVFLFAVSAVNAQQSKQPLSSTDSVLVHKTTFSGFAASHLLHHTIAPTVYYLAPQEGVDQVYQLKINAMQRIGYLMNFSLHKYFSANVELGATIYSLEQTTAIVTDVAISPATGVPYANSWFAWNERKTGAGAYIDFSLGYRPLHTARFDLYAGPGVTLQTRYHGMSRLTPAAQYYFSVSPKIQLKKRTWLQLRADYGVTSSEAFLKYKTFGMLQAGVVFRFDRIYREPKHKPLYIRVYDDE